MTLKEYQKQLQLGRLYEIKKRGGIKGVEQKEENLWINSGGVDIYIYNGATQPTSLAEMGDLETENTDASGSLVFDMIPRYIAMVQNSGASTDIVATGLDVVDLGAIS